MDDTASSTVGGPEERFPSPGPLNVCYSYRCLPDPSKCRCCSYIRAFIVKFSQFFLFRISALASQTHL